MPAPLKTFIIYASADRELRTALERQLKSLIDNGLIQLWSDKEILPGEQWDSAIKKQLLEAELFLMLISTDFFNSDYIREKEFVAALQKLERGEAIVIPIIVRDCDWEAYFEIQQLHVLPRDGIAVTDLEHWKSVDKAWANVVRGIRRRVEESKTKQNERKTTQPLPKKPPSKQIPKRFIALAGSGLAVLLLVWYLFLQGKNWMNWTQNENPNFEKGLQKPPVLHNEPQEEKKLEGIEVSRDEKISGLHMVLVRGGKFTMGSKDFKQESPPHEVSVKTFSIGKYEVTQADWRKIMGDNLSEIKSKGCDRCPIEGISWNDIQKFLATLNRKVPGQNYRLPTEAEWEFAAKGGIQSRNFKYSGNNDPGAVAWFAGNSYGKVHPVGELADNELGIFDMSGNVWEWVQDEWHNTYDGAPTDGSAWVQNGYIRVLRGGAYNYGTDAVKITRRNLSYPAKKDSCSGFRLARD